MFHTLKHPHAVGRHLGRHRHEAGQSQRCEGVIHIVDARQLQILLAANHPLAPFLAKDQLPIPQHGAVFHLLCGGDISQLRRDSGGQIPGEGIIQVQHRQVCRRLVFKHPGFQGDVVVHGAVAVQVIRCDVEQRCRPGMKIPHRLQLETGDLGDQDVLILCP